MIQALEIFQSLPLATPAIISGSLTLLAATGLIYSQRGRMRELNASVAQEETVDSH